MNIYIKIVFEFYDLCIRFIQFLSYIFLFMFHNQIVYIKCINSANEISYIVPLLQLCFHNKYIPGISMYDSFEPLELCQVSYVKKSMIEHFVCKNRSVFDVQNKVNHLDHNMNYEKRHIIAKKYIFVEIGIHNVTDSYKQIGWSLIDEDITVEDYKKILELPTNDQTLDLTDADNLDIQELKNDDIIV